MMKTTRASKQLLALIMAVFVSATIHAQETKAKQFVVKGSDCITADKNCMLKVDPFVDAQGERAYHVNQFCGHNTKWMYSKNHPLIDQVADQKYVGNRFCKGILTLSEESIATINLSSDEIVVTYTKPTELKKQV